jgi:hypothetical protein
MEERERSHQKKIQKKEIEIKVLNHNEMQMMGKQ